MSLARTLLLAAIRAYKRHLSPRKGYSCAYRVHRGACSCSTLGLRAVSRLGAWRGLGVLRLRLRRCRSVAEQAHARRVVARPAQAGFLDCDLPCDASCVDAPSCSPDHGCSIDDACTCLDCADCGDCGDWPRSRRRRRRGSGGGWPCVG